MHMLLFSSSLPLFLLLHIRIFTSFSPLNNMVMNMISLYYTDKLSVHKSQKARVFCFLIFSLGVLEKKLGEDVYWFSCVACPPLDCHCGQAGWLSTRTDCSWHTSPPDVAQDLGCLLYQCHVKKFWPSWVTYHPVHWLLRGKDIGLCYQKVDWTERVLGQLKQDSELPPNTP